MSGRRRFSPVVKWSSRIGSRLKIHSPSPPRQQPGQVREAAAVSVVSNPAIIMLFSGRGGSDGSAPIRILQEPRAQQSERPFALPNVPNDPIIHLFATSPLRRCRNKLSRHFSILLVSLLVWSADTASLRSF